MVFFPAGNLFAEDISGESKKKGYEIQPIETIPSTGIASLENPADNRFTWWVSVNPEDPVRLSREILRDTSALEKLPTHFTGTKVPLSHHDKLKTGKNEILWYAKTFIHRAETDKALVLRLGKISDRDRVYLNGKLVGATGKFDEEEPQSYDIIRNYEIPEGTLQKGKKNVILIQVQNYFTAEWGIVRDKVGIGYLGTMRREMAVSDYGAYLFLASYLTAGGYFFFLFLRRRSEKSYLFFSIFIFDLVMYQFFQTQTKYELPIRFYMLKKIEYLNLVILMPSFFMYISSYFSFPQNIFFRILKYISYLPLGLNALLGLFILAPTSVIYWDKYNNLINLQFAFPVLLVASLALVIHRILNFDRDAIIIGVGLLFLVATTMVDLAIHYGYINIPRISSYVVFAFILSLALILANQFVRVHNEVEDLNKNLEKKVEDRTAELQKTLAQVQALKTQQDGDYFLTSLLIEPLSKNLVDSKQSKVEFLVKEKKEFSFRQWSREIGGDMCSAHSLKLRGNDYIMLMNADAMGKSMQGAGGVLVMGSVFASIIERTKFSPDAYQQSPEQWLKYSFIELNKVFASFNGSMLVSVFLAAFEEATGVMYYINAEHPWTILYRNQRAVFIENELFLRKLGMIGDNSDVVVKLQILENQDCILAGSDGRDDLLLGMDSEGNRIINEDENLILQLVEEANCDLKNLYGVLKNTGEITDDLSLLKLTYEAPPEKTKPERGMPPDTQGALDEIKAFINQKDLSNAIAQINLLAEKYANNLPLIWTLCKLQTSIKNYAGAAKLSALIIEKFPAESEFLYMGSFSAKLSGNYTMAIDFGERLFARNPMHLKNLINLIDCHILHGSPARAEKLLVRADKIDPDNEKIHRLSTALNRKISAPQIQETDVLG